MYYKVLYGAIITFICLIMAPYNIYSKPAFKSEASINNIANILSSKNNLGNIVSVSGRLLYEKKVLDTKNKNTIFQDYLEALYLHDGTGKIEVVSKDNIFLEQVKMQIGSKLMIIGVITKLKNSEKVISIINYNLMN